MASVPIHHPTYGPSSGIWQSRTFQCPYTRAPVPCSPTLDLYLAHPTAHSGISPNSWVPLQPCLNLYTWQLLYLPNLQVLRCNHLAITLPASLYAGTSLPISSNLLYRPLMQVLRCPTRPLVQPYCTLWEPHASSSHSGTVPSLRAKARLGQY